MNYDIYKRDELFQSPQNAPINTLSQKFGETSVYRPRLSSYIVKHSHSSTSTDFSFMHSTYTPKYNNTYMECGTQTDINELEEIKSLKIQLSAINEINKTLKEGNERLKADSIEKITKLKKDKIKFSKIFKRYIKKQEQLMEQHTLETIQLKEQIKLLNDENSNLQSQLKNKEIKIYELNRSNKDLLVKVEQLENENKHLNEAMISQIELMRNMSNERIERLKSIHKAEIGNLVSILNQQV